MLYNNERKEWEHSGGSSGISRVHVYHHPIHNTYRIVGRKLQDHAVFFQLVYSNSFFCDKLLLARVWILSWKSYLASFMKIFYVLKMLTTICAICVTFLAWWGCGWVVLWTPCFRIKKWYFYILVLELLALLRVEEELRERVFFGQFGNLDASTLQHLLG